MKTLFTLVASIIGFISFSQIEVQEKTVNVNGSHNGIAIKIPYGDAKMIDKELKDELKSWKGKFSSEKGYYFADDCKLKSMGDNTFDVYAKVEENTEVGATVLVAVDLGGAYMSSSEHGAQYKIIEKKLYDFGVSAAKNVIDEEVKTEEKVLEEKEKELEDLQKEKEKKEKEIEDYKKKIEENEEAIKENEKQQADKESDIETQKTKLQGVKDKKDAVK